MLYVQSFNTMTSGYLIRYSVAVTCLNMLHTCMCKAGFEGSPGIITSDPGQTNSFREFRWTLKTPFNINDPGADLSVFKRFNDVSNLVVRYTPYINCSNFGDSRLFCILPMSEGNTVGFIITEINLADADKYICVVRYSLSGPAVSNDNGTLYVYQRPSVQIEGDTSVPEGFPVTLTCSATSQSQPAGVVTAVFVYSWTITNPAGNHIEDNNVIRIDPVVRENNGATFKCSVREFGSSLARSTSITLDISYAPYNIRLSGGGPSEVAVAGQPAPVTRTCQADCRPDCTYRWDNQSGSTLTFDSVRKEDHGIHTCWASNALNTEGITTQFNLTVNYPPEISTFSEFDDLSETVLKCNVLSRPMSNITIENKANDTILTSEIGQVVHHRFTNIQCLDTGDYLCLANNGIGPNGTSNDYHLNVYCSYSPLKTSITAWKGVGDNYSFTANMTANPFEEVSTGNLTFISNEQINKTKTPPDNVNIFVRSTDHDVVKQIIFSITNITESNYGSYAILMTNYGPTATINILLETQGSSVSVVVVVACSVTSAAIVVVMIIVIMWWRAGKFNRKPQPTD